MYSDFGKTSGQVAMVVAFFLMDILWFVLGTIIAIRVFRNQLRVRWLGLIVLVTVIAIFPLTFAYLLGVGHS